MKRNPNGTGHRWLKSNAAYKGDDCLLWPFSCCTPGYGQLMIDYKVAMAHRVMCTITHGPAPSDKHEAAHSCGRGKDGCVHPKHLSWKTPTGNALDSRSHGTQARNPWGNKGKITRRQIAEIWALKGRETQAETGKRFNVSASTIRDIYLGRSHLGMTAVAMLRLLSQRELGDMPNFSSGLWSRRNLEAMIDDLVADTNESGSSGQSTQNGAK